MSSPLRFAAHVAALLLPCAALIGCKQAAVETGPGLFVHGCPEPGRAVARIADDPGFFSEGSDALAAPGDALLMNEKAAFVITGIGEQRTYYLYPGILVDAVAVDGCAQASPERFGELGLLMGNLDVNPLHNSTLRAFEGRRIEIVSDGSDGGEARVRVHGRDSTFWLVELTLIQEAFKAGDPKPRSGRLGLEVYVDYVLRPGESVLAVELHAARTETGPDVLFAGAALFPGPHTPTVYYADDRLSLGGFSMDVGVPWLASGGGDGSYAFAIENAQAATTNISGTEVFVDSKQLGSPMSLPPAGQGTAVMRFFVSVGGDDPNSAVAGLYPKLGEPIRGAALDPFLLNGRTVALEGGAGVPSRVDVRLRNTEGALRTIDRIHTEADGSFSADLTTLGAGREELSLIAWTPGRGWSEAVDAAPGSGAVTLGFAPAGRVDVDIRDSAGNTSPAAVTFELDGNVVDTRFTDGAGVLHIPPGSYRVTVTRGLEHAPVSVALDIPPDGAAPLSVVLDRVVDTAGWVTLDTHMHQEPSVDSDVLFVDRITAAAADGLEVILATDHEYITDLRPHIDKTTMGSVVTSVPGSEVTCSLPEHMTGLAFPPAAPGEPRTDYVRWYGMDIGEAYAAIRGRGAQAVGLNHPRQGCKYMCLIDYDRGTGRPNLTDPTLLGFEADQDLWSWDFDFFEMQNGTLNIFLDPERPQSTGLFDDWQSFLNHGHRITAVASTDTHGLRIGLPQTYIRVPDDSIESITPDQVAAAVLEGRALTSTGAFARIRVNGVADIGDEIIDTDGSIDLSLRVEALPAIDVDTIEIYVNCDKVLDFPTNAPDALVKHDAVIPVPISSDSHITVLGFGDAPMPTGLQDFNPERIPRFLTNAIYIDADDNGIWTPPGGKVCSY